MIMWLRRSPGGKRSREEIQWSLTFKSCEIQTMEGDFSSPFRAIYFLIGFGFHKRSTLGQFPCIQEIMDEL